MLVGCADRPAPSTFPASAVPTTAAVAASPTPPTPLTTPTTPTATPAAAGCPDASFDPTASLGPEFDTDNFVHESPPRSTDFLDGLATLYRNAKHTDPCRWFTGQGLRTATATDFRDSVSR